MKNRGLTFLEMLISLMIFSIAMLGYFQMFNVAINSQLRTKQEIIGANLARALMSEILVKEFKDPTEPLNPLGPDTGETNRILYDDVDDYDDGSIENPPRTIDGTPMNGAGVTPDYSDFSRSAIVEYCEIIDNPDPTPDDVLCGPAKPLSDYKKVTVTVTGSYLADITIDELSVDSSP
ncbi:MAG: prepilin-type N-terminal cleavage/methylation domain-containing protein [Candidatus Omnitrophota bacterium]